MSLFKVRLDPTSGPIENSLFRSNFHFAFLTDMDTDFLYGKHFQVRVEVRSVSSEFC